MFRSSLAFLLLTALSLGLLAGPHPCAGLHQERNSEHASCHEAGSHPSNSPHVRQEASESDNQDCCSTLCHHACQMTAVADADQVTIDIAPVSQAVVELSDSGLPLFAHPIDHVPLA